MEARRRWRQKEKLKHACWGDTKDDLADKRINGLTELYDEEGTLLVREKQGIVQ